jgi:phosphatidate phosphatase APP1
LPFVLIGDSGEQDPEIYRQIVEENPKRVRVIYIRSVNRHPSRIQAIDKLVEEVRETECQLVLTPDSEFAAAHAAAEGLISTDELACIRSEKKNDKSALKDETLAKLV